MNRRLISFYGDDFTGSTDALEQLTLAGVRTALFLEPPDAEQLKQFPGLQGIGVAGLTRSLAPAEMTKVLRPALRKLKALGAAHVHYKVCSTFDSAPEMGSIGRVLEVGAEIFRARFVPLVAAAPALGRYTVFGTHFARYGIGSAGAIHRLDRHPSISRHPVTPMTEADLRRHLARQTSANISLFDVLQVALPAREARQALKTMLAERPDGVLFDAVYPEHLTTIGALLDQYAKGKHPLFSIGSSGIETALGSHWQAVGKIHRPVRPLESTGPVQQILVGSGSCSPVTSGQIAWALKHGFQEVAMNPAALIGAKTGVAEINRVVTAAVTRLAAGHSVIVHTTKSGADARLAKKLQGRSAEVLGSALGTVMHQVITQHPVTRLCVAGGDTTSYAARALGIEALEMISSLTPGAPLCRVHAPNSPLHGREAVFKGGQVGGEDYFKTVRKGSL